MKLSLQITLVSVEFLLMNTIVKSKLIVWSISGYFSIIISDLWGQHEHQSYTRHVYSFWVKAEKDWVQKINNNDNSSIVGKNTDYPQT